jgi:hypothetical protein
MAVRRHRRAVPLGRRRAANVTDADASPDGSLVACFTSGEPVTVTIQATVGERGPQVEVARGGTDFFNAIWAPSGRQLYFVQNGRLMRVSVEAAPTA